MFFSKAKADSWIDPGWREMLDSSDVIALVEYSSGGGSRAMARVLTIYKGGLKAGEKIWITGFSNRYGPFDKMRRGQRYLVFLNAMRQERLEYWEDELAENPKLGKFVAAIRSHSAFYVWSPTSGDLRVKRKKVQYDLLQTSYYKKQGYYSFAEFDHFLRAYFDRSQAEAYIQSILPKARIVSEQEINAQYLMQLHFLGFNRYEPVFAEYARVSNPSARYALARLMGGILTEDARNILVTLLDDPHSLVQGEAVRQLRNFDPAVVAPVLLRKLSKASKVNFGPGNIMNPLMNTVDGGQTEIINTLAELRYRPAIPELLPLLDTDDSRQFDLVIGALKQIGTKEYIPYINRHLDQKTHRLMYSISTLIAKDSLVECLPSFKHFISTCNRNEVYDHTISSYGGIGRFSDSATIAFLLSDWDRFFTYKDTLESRRQKDWTRSYLYTFTALKNKAGKALAYRTIYDWLGIHQDFGRYPQLFAIKKQCEDSLRRVFSARFLEQGYELKHCIAFIQNTREVSAGKPPEADFMLGVTVPVAEKGDAQRTEIARAFHLDEQRVFIRFSDGVYYLHIQERFRDGFSSSPLDAFLDYLKAVPEETDLVFLQSLQASNYINDNYLKEKVQSAVEKIEATLNEK